MIQFHLWLEHSVPKQQQCDRKEILMECMRNRPFGAPAPYNMCIIWIRKSNMARNGMSYSTHSPHVGVGNNRTYHIYTHHIEVEKTSKSMKIESFKEACPHTAHITNTYAEREAIRNKKQLIFQCHFDIPFYKCGKWHQYYTGFCLIKAYPKWASFLRGYFFFFLFHSFTWRVLFYFFILSSEFHSMIVGQNNDVSIIAPVVMATYVC